VSFLERAKLARYICGECVMRTFVALIVIVYLIGVGVQLAPTISGKWNTVTAADLFGSVWVELPAALSWPVAAYHRLVDTQPTLRS
jgi:hypothetical protein